MERIRKPCRRRHDEDGHTNLHRLRGNLTANPHGRTSDGGLYNEHMAGKLHDDDGDSPALLGVC